MGYAAPIAGVMGLVGAGVSSYGAYEQGQARAASDIAAANTAAYQAQVARNNAVIAGQNVTWTEASGESKTAAVGMRTRAAVGTEKAVQGASGIDVNTGSAPNVRAARAQLGALDALTIRSNAAREAYGFEVKEASETAEAGLKQYESAYDTTAAATDKQAGDIAALGTLLTGASSVGGKFAGWQQGSPLSSPSVNNPTNLFSLT